MSSCIICGRFFRKKIWNQICCSTDCSIARHLQLKRTYRQRIKKLTTRCVICGKKIIKKPKSNPKYCGNECRLTARRGYSRKYRDYKMDFEIPEKKLRPCLKCGVEWETTANWRICPGCRGENNSMQKTYRLVGPGEAI